MDEGTADIEIRDQYPGLELARKHGRDECRWDLLLLEPGHLSTGVAVLIHRAARRRAHVVSRKSRRSVCQRRDPRWRQPDAGSRDSVRLAELLSRHEQLRAALFVCVLAGRITQD